MRFEVPQFIEIEDKIIGPLTWKQFVYIAGGGGILLVLYLTTKSFIILVTFGLPIGALAFALAFHRVNNRPFSIFLEAFFTHFTSTRLYIWQKDRKQTVVLKTTEEETANSSLAYTKKGSISKLADRLEHHSHNTSS